MFLLVTSLIGVLRTYCQAGTPRLFYNFYAGMVWFCRAGSVRIRGHGKPEAASKSDYRLLFSGANATGGLISPLCPKKLCRRHYFRKRCGFSRLMLNKC